MTLTLKLLRRSSIAPTLLLRPPRIRFPDKLPVPPPLGFAPSKVLNHHSIPPLPPTSTFLFSLLFFLSMTIYLSYS